MQKNLIFVLKTNQDYIRCDESNILNNEVVLSRLFDNVSDIYIPLLDMFSKFDEEGIKAKMGIVLSPVLCTMLENVEIQNLYTNWLEKHILLGQKEVERNKDNEEILEISKKLLEKYTSLKNSFEVKYNKSIISAFSSLRQKGYFEIIATCGTDIYVPHFNDLPEVVSAQIEIGLKSFRNSFGEIPDGFWLPELGYAPDVEKLIRGYGFSYTIVDARSVLLADKIPSKGIFHPYRFENALGLFAADPFVTDELFGEDGYSMNTVYRNENCDIGFELSADELNTLISTGVSRYSTGYKYWNKDSDDEDKTVYNFSEANSQLSIDAKDFLSKKDELLESASKEIKESDFISLVCCLDSDTLHSQWNEGILWLEQVFREGANYSFDFANCNELIEEQFAFEKVTPYYSSAAGYGYGENLISNKNSWMIRYIRKACERMIDLADRFPNDTGLKTRLLNIGAKELMIAQSSGLQKMIDQQEFPEYAEKRFKESIFAFTEVFNSLGSNKVSTEWLTTLEIKDSLFPWMNYRIFSKKK